MNSIKVAMGFLEVAAAMKFISNVDLVWKWGIFTRSVVLGDLDCDRHHFGDLSFRQIPAFARFETRKNRRVSPRFGNRQSGDKFLFINRTFRRETRRARIVSAAGIWKIRRSGFNSSKSAEELNWIDNDFEGALAQAKAENKRFSSILRATPARIAAGWKRMFFRKGKSKPK